MRVVAVTASLLLMASTTTIAGPPAQLESVHRIVFLGDSITYAGQYVETIEAYLKNTHPSLRCEFLNLGLPSETASGLSEPGHAGGQFPRPDVHERLGRVLERTKPDLVVACYGMNDGIYYPFDADRLRKFEEGLRSLRKQAGEAGARVLHVTPPVFDPEPIRARTLPAGLAEYRQPYEGYDDVLTRYSEWLVERRKDGWEVIDIHRPMKEFLDRERGRDSKYRLADDGVHLNAIGHWIIARRILAHWGVPEAELAGPASGEEAMKRWPRGSEVLALVERKQRVLKDAWLTATKHKRPGMAQGEPLERAERIARDVDSEIDRLLKADR